MVEPLFVSATEWLDQVRRVLARPGELGELHARGLDLERVLAIAQAEAASARRDGRSLLGHEDLAQAAGVPRSDVLRTRLYLVDVGMQSLSIPSGASGRIQRLLHEA